MEKSVGSLLRQIFISFILLITQSSDGFGQFNAFSFSNESKQMERLEFDLIHNLIILPVFINESDTLRFVLDSGIQNTMITDLSPGDSVQLSFGREINISGLGEGEAIRAIHSWGNTIRIGSMVGNNQDILVLLENKMFLSASLGIEIHGLIGYDLMKDFVVKINYEREYIEFHKPGTYQVKSRWKEIPIEFTRSKPYVMARIKMEESKETALKMLIDMGASYAASLYTFAHKEISFPDKTIDAFLGKGLNGDINGKVGRAEYIVLGGHRFDNPIISFPDSGSASRVTDLPGHHGSIGSDVLTRFHVVFDYPSAKVYLRPNRYARRTFSYNLSGLELAAPLPGMRVYVVDRVWDHSPAMYAGLEKGDLLEKINGDDVHTMPMHRIMELLNSKPGRRVWITIMRDARPVNLKIILKDMI